MGLLAQLKRAVKRKVKRSSPNDEVIVLPSSWKKQRGASKLKEKKKKAPVFVQKTRIPGLQWINKGLAVVLLFLNFVFSQFLLGAIGEQAQPMFLLFLGNCYIIARYLWASRRREE